VSDADNLVARAAEALALELGREAAGHLRIEKCIPLAAGLGGGSSDAAAALRLLNQLWQSGVRPERLAEIAARLGSDVPLFLTGGTALLRGRGEQVEALPSPPTFWLALACPSFHTPDKTRRLYAALQPTEWSDGRVTRQLADRIRDGAAVFDASFINSFDGPAVRVHPDFAVLRSRLADAAGTPLHLTGAGPSVFALCTSRAHAEGAARRMGRHGVRTFVARSIAHRPSIRRVGTVLPSAAPREARGTARSS
jgi:4-diphosphocytidyl-2-C-methyl-D-erythritol kinase